MPLDCAVPSRKERSISDEKNAKNRRVDYCFPSSRLLFVVHSQRETMHLPGQRLRALFFLIVVGAVAGCTLNTDVMGVGQVAIFAGDNQSQPVNTLLPQPLQVLV